jgi:hypothetical protein
VGRVRQLVGAVVLTVALGGCSTAEAPAPAEPPPPPPPPPAACLLDTTALAAATGLSWTPDATTANDTRCVYDPPGDQRPADGPAFLSVDVAAATALDTVAELCEKGSRAPVGTAGFVCRYQGGNVFAAVAHEGRLVTLAASAVPTGTTAAQLVVAFDQQVAALSR